MLRLPRVNLCLCEQCWWGVMWVCDWLGDSAGLCREARGGDACERDDKGSWYWSQPQSGGALLQVTQESHTDIWDCCIKDSLENLACFYPPPPPPPTPLSHHQASGDIRSNGDRYIYHIQLSGITNNSLSSCLGANICQVKLNGQYRRRIGSSNKAKYYIKGDLWVCLVSHFWRRSSPSEKMFVIRWLPFFVVTVVMNIFLHTALPSGENLDVMVPSESTCGREKTKMAYSTIMFHCNPTAGVGIPEFMLETDECQYLFMWHTKAVCGLTWVNTFTLMAINCLELVKEIIQKLKDFVRLIELLKRSHLMTTATASPGGARRSGWCWPSCWWAWLPVCSGFYSTRERGGEKMSAQQKLLVELSL